MKEQFSVKCDCVTADEARTFVVLEERIARLIMDAHEDIETIYKSINGCYTGLAGEPAEDVSSLYNALLKDIDYLLILCRKIALIRDQIGTKEN